MRCGDRMEERHKKKNKKRKNGPPDIFIFISTVLLLSIGIIIVYSASSVMAYTENGDSAYFLKKQLMWALIGIVMMIFTMNIDYRFFEKVSLPLLLLSIGFLALEIGRASCRERV